MACRTDTGLFCDLVLVVNVHFVEFNGGGRRVLREIVKDRADGPTRTAPGSPEINDYGLIPGYLILGHEETLSGWNGGRRRTICLNCSSEVTTVTVIAAETVWGEPKSWPGSQTLVNLVICQPSYT